VVRRASRRLRRGQPTVLEAGVLAACLPGRGAARKPAAAAREPGRRQAAGWLGWGRVGVSLSHWRRCLLSVAVGRQSYSICQLAFVMSSPACLGGPCLAAVRGACVGPAKQGPALQLGPQPDLAGPVARGAWGFTHCCCGCGCLLYWRHDAALQPPTEAQTSSRKSSQR
jgi:hypothetical protein